MTISVTGSDGRGGSVSESSDLVASTATSARPVVTIVAGTSPVTESPVASFTVTAAPAPSANLDVNLSVTEAAGSDFVAFGNKGMKMVTAPTASVNVTITYTVATVNDEPDEPDVSVMVTVTNGTNYTVRTPSEAGMIKDNDDDDMRRGRLRWGQRIRRR